MIELHRLRPQGARQQRVWLAAGLVVLVILVAIPFGLGALGRSGVSSEGDAPTRGGMVSEADAAGSDGAGSDSAGSNSAGSGAGPIAPEAPGAGDGSPREGTARDDKAPTATSGQVPGAVQALGNRLARTASLGLKVADLAAASARVRAIAAAAGGQVLSESVVTAADPTGSSRDVKGGTGPLEDVGVVPVGLDEARITLGVPADRLDSVLDDLSAANVGTVSYRSSRSEDVTETYVDTQARIQPAKDSIARVRALMVKATTLDQIVLLESELARRQSDLDSLEQRLAELDRRTTTATVSVSLWTDATTSAQPGENRFVDSLAKAWGAFLDSIMVVVTGLAVLLPWLLIAAVIAWLVRRWLRRRGGAAPAAD
ncbi:DUF4349 domain-containing protein [Intrasporangium sp.]|uniref:DUF4349 domain-containing protein n=1 Tax=Intrasporangium sp. TaxID=1925024 RepID=UPI00293AE5F4|nr:DUF4349 domain-containing protein [Intrasporangium sp.]MDV3223224.1 DUF4349 domain-containing protein [Intrasporangium sp.]